MRYIVSLLISLFLAGTLRAEPLILATEPYPPFVTVQDGKVSGRSITLVNRILDSTGQPYTIEVMPWARAIGLAEKQNMHCAFAAARTPEREALFNWVEPMLIIRTVLVTAAGSGVSATTLENARRYVVGTHRGDFTETLLKSLGFTRIDITNEFPLSLRKLVNHRIDLMPMSEYTFDSLVRKGEKLEIVVPLAQERLGIACNRGVPADLIARMNANLQHLRDSGEASRILLDKPEPEKTP